MNKEEEPKIDESLLTEEQRKELHKPSFKPIHVVLPAIIIALMAVCIIVIFSIH